MSAAPDSAETHESPDDIRKDIERTRDRIADTAEALAYKTDVPARLKDNVAERVDAVKGAIAGATSKLTQGVHDVSQTTKSNINGASHSLEDTKATVQTKLADATDTLKGNISDLGDTAQAKLEKTGKATKSVALDAKGLLEKNPLGLALGSIAAGFLLGLALPVSDLERENVGPLGERVAGQARQAANEMVEQGKTVVATAVSDALSGARN